MTFHSAPDSASLFLSDLAQANPVAAMFLAAVICAGFAAWIIKAVF